jgi:hypothetical protein
MSHADKKIVIKRANERGEREMFPTAMTIFFSAWFPSLRKRVLYRVMRRYSAAIAALLYEAEMRERKR